MPDLGKPEILILLIVIFALFGAKRLPGAARSLGQSMRIFKAETRGLRNDDNADAGAVPSSPTAALPSSMPAFPAPSAVQEQQAPPLHQ